MNPQSPEREELPARDRRWVEALRGHAPDGPPPALDAAVLAAARTAIGAKAAAPTGRGGGAPGWLAAVAGVMVVLSAGVLVRQVAQETAPKSEPGFPASPSVAAPSPRSAAEERADAVRRATREAEGLPAWETVEAEPPAEANAADAAAAPAPEAAPIAAQARAERAMRAQAAEASPTAPPPPPPEPPALRQMAPAAEPIAPPAPPAPAQPAADFAPSRARPLAESAPAPAAFSDPAPIAAAKSALAERREQAEAGLAAASAEQEAGLPEPDVLAEVRRLLAAGDRDAARDLLRAWRERHPAVVLPAELAAAERDAPG